MVVRLMPRVSAARVLLPLQLCSTSLATSRSMSASGRRRSSVELSLGAEVDEKRAVRSRPRASRTLAAVTRLPWQVANTQSSTFRSCR